MRQAGRQTDRQTDRQTEIDINAYTQTVGQTDKLCFLIIVLIQAGTFLFGLIFFFRFSLF